MGQAINIVKNIMKNEELYTRWGLNIRETGRKWEPFNILIGENGSGKSRMLQMIREGAKDQCTVIYLDFANYVQFSGNEDEGADNTEDNGLIDMLVFRNTDKREVFLNLLKYLDNQMVSVFDELFNMGNDRYVRNRVHSILNELRPSIESILHREIEVREDGIYLCKEGREVIIKNEWSVLSPGERSILTVIFAVLFIKLLKEPCILLIDELETHLHPDAQVKLYRLVKQALEKTDVDHCTCIASHSIFLLPLFKIHELVYMNNGRIGKLNGGLYQQIYDNLTGEGEKKEESLTDFMYSMSAWQYADYLAECFLAPTTVDEAKSDDEQALKLVEILKDFRKRKDIIEILDFGAGTGRIGKCMELMEEERSEAASMLRGLRYHIYDRYSISGEFKKNTGWRGGAYGSEKGIISSKIKFDIILLYNVLHEIGVDEWVKELGFMLSLLAEGGILLFGEREILSVGEKPYGKSGYLVLGKEELLELFPRSRIKEVFLPDKQKTVTWCYSITKPVTEEGYPSEEGVKAALQTLKNRTKEKIRNRERNGLGERGKSRKYAFYCQQYVNAEEAIEIMEESKELIGAIEAEKEFVEKEPPAMSKPREKAPITLADIIQAPLTWRDKMGMIKELAEKDTEEGEKARKYLE
ncbi:MAG: AAA family ATPase [Lachnospiraceae bacterium]|nr:AAA family ATPase [Lachnospiraceae bacterium]